MSAPATSRNIPLGLPFQGMDLQTPLSALPITRAPFIENFFIDGQVLKVRSGSASYSGIAGSGASETVYAPAAYNKTDGTSVLFAYMTAGGGATGVYNFSAALAVLSDALLYSAVNLYPIQFRTYFYLMDGQNQPRAFDGTSWANIGFTGPASIAKLKSGNAYKNRLYLVEKDTTKVWYGGVDSISGAMTSFDIGSLLTKGGSLFNVYPFSGGSASDVGADQYLAFITSEGEVLIYTGSYPGSATWEIVSRFQIGKPLSTRGHCFYQGDTLLMTSTGFVSLRDCLRQGSNAGLYSTISQPIDPYIRALMSTATMAEPIARQTVSVAFFSMTGCIYISIPKKLTRTNNKLSTDAAADGGVVLVYNTLNGSWSFYIYPDESEWLGLCEYSNKLIAGAAGRYVFELEKAGAYRDEIPESLSTYNAISANILSAAVSSNRDSGARQKFNALELYAYVNAGSATDPVQCYLVENFGKTTGTTKPAIIEDDFNSLDLRVGSSREYVQYALTVKTNSSSGDPTVLYNMNALVEQGGYR